MIWPVPDNAAQWELWAQAAATWMAVNYVFAARVGRQALLAMTEAEKKRWLHQVGYRALLGASALYALPGFTRSWQWPRVLLAGCCAVALLVLALGRLGVSRNKRLCSHAAEWEILLNGLAMFALGAIIAHYDMVVAAPAFEIPLSNGRSAAVSSCLAAGIFVMGGGTHIVRGVLDKADALPPARAGAPEATRTPESIDPAERRFDVSEYQRGRTIGNIERLLMLIVVGAGSYEALGFLIAAKSLIRGKELDDRAFAEYFIVGNLTSAAVAVSVAILLKAIVAALWAM